MEELGVKFRTEGLVKCVGGGEAVDGRLAKYLEQEESARQELAREELAREEIAVAATVQAAVRSMAGRKEKAQYKKLRQKEKEVERKIPTVVDDDDSMVFFVDGPKHGD